MFDKITNNITKLQKTRLRRKSTKKITNEYKVIKSKYKFVTTLSCSWTQLSKFVSLSFPTRRVPLQLTPCAHKLLQWSTDTKRTRINPNFHCVHTYDQPVFLKVFHQLNGHYQTIHPSYHFQTPDRPKIASFSYDLDHSEDLYRLHLLNCFIIPHFHQ